MTKNEPLNVGDMTLIEDEFGDRWRLRFYLPEGMVKLWERDGGKYGGACRQVGEHIDDFMRRIGLLIKGWDSGNWGNDL